MENQTKEKTQNGEDKPLAFTTKTEASTTHLNSDHERTTNMLGYALTMNDTDTWLGTVQVLKARLSDEELASLSYVTLKAQGPDNATMTAEAVLGRYGTPIPPLISVMDEAAHWADWAAPQYVTACVLAGYNRMSPSDQIAFLKHVNIKAAA